MITGMPRIAIAVRDFDAILSTFRDKLGMPVVDVSESTVQSLGAKIAMCVPGEGSNIELMSPAVEDAPLSQSLSRFLDRRGEGLFALMLEAADPNAEAEELTGRGLHVLPLMAGAGGRDVHPKSTHGVLIRVYPTNSFKKPADFQQPAPDAARLSGVQRVIIATHDIHSAVDVYGARLGINTDNIQSCEHRGVAAATVHPPTGGTIELAAVENADRPFARQLHDFLQQRGDGMFALVLKSDDLGETAKTLASRGLAARTADDTPDVLEVDRDSAYGALLRIEAA